MLTDEQGDGQEETPAQQQARMSASSATRELDELMASLSDFKVQSNVSTLHRSVEFRALQFSDLMEGVYFWHCVLAFLLRKTVCYTCLGVFTTVKLFVKINLIAVTLSILC